MLLVVVLMLFVFVAQADAAASCAVAASGRGIATVALLCSLFVHRCWAAVATRTYLVRCFFCFCFFYWLAALPHVPTPPPQFRRRRLQDFFYL